MNDEALIAERPVAVSTRSITSSPGRVTVSLTMDVILPTGRLSPQTIDRSLVPFDEAVRAVRRDLFNRIREDMREASER